jgi:putative membrane protein
MLIRILLKLLILSGAIWLTAWLLPNVNVRGGFWTYVWIAVLFSLVNMFIGPILHLLALPLTIVTFGLFALVVNAGLVGITAWLSKDFNIHGFFPAVFAALLIAIFSSVMNLLVPDRR